MEQAPAETRVEHLWFSSETLVLRAETKIFQVPKALLAARSSVFRDMIGLPQLPGNDTELYEGIPVVNLSDAASDVDAFLTAILDSSYFMPAPEPIRLAAVLGILRLAHKYDVPYLYTRALKRLSIRYGLQSLEQFLTAERDYITFEEWNYTGQCIKVIQALTEVSALWLLPMAYYRLCSNGQTILLQQVEGRETMIRKCLVAQALLRKGTAAVNRFLTTPSTPFCTDYQDCNRCRAQELDRYLCQVEDGEDLRPLSNWDDDDWESTDFCRYCGDVARLEHAEARQKVWDDLPNIFGLPPWAELYAMRDAVMNGT
ncbi:hypothetical protein DFH06DRAFT_1107334 [Mycena polygramma]|nr:hypothetical protein DFH06DRAFT_1107334 [Mycena polygramma]